MPIFRPSTFKTENFSKKIKGPLCVNKGTFDTIFNMGYGGGVRHPPSGKSPMDERVNKENVSMLVFLYQQEFYIYMVFC